MIASVILCMGAVEPACEQSWAVFYILSVLTHLYVLVHMWYANWNPFYGICTHVCVRIYVVMCVRVWACELCVWMTHFE